MLRIRLTPTAITAIFCLLIGGVRPACALITSFQSAATRALSDETADSNDGESQEEDSNAEKGNAATIEDEDAPKLVGNRLHLIAVDNAMHQAYTVYLFIFKDHHPEVITPPPKA